jgi:hypothetical protein
MNDDELKALILEAFKVPPIDHYHYPLAPNQLRHLITQAVDAERTGKDSLTVDAERYRWLRGEMHDPRPPLARVVWKRNNIRDSADWTDLSDGQTLDEHIDAAIRARG